MKHRPHRRCRAAARGTISRRLRPSGGQACLAAPFRPAGHGKGLELAHLFYGTLGNQAGITPGGSFQPRSQANTNTGPFADLEGLFLSSVPADRVFADSCFWLAPVNPLASTTSA